MAYGKIKADAIIYDNSGSDVEVSTADITSKANLASPTFTGTPAAPTASSGTNTTQLATTAFVTTDIANLSTTVTNSLATKLPLAGGNLTGDLTFDTNKITLNATNGNITTAGNSSVTGFLTVTGAINGLSKVAGGGDNSEAVFQVYSNTLAAYKTELYADGSASFSGAVTADSYKTPAQAVSALAIDLATGNYFTKTIAGNSTFTFTNPPASGTVGSFTLELTHSSGTVAWPASVKWPADTAPTLTAGKTHLFIFVTDDGGSRYRGAALADYVN